MLEKIKRYRELKEKIAKLKIEIMENDGDILEAEDPEYLSKSWKLRAKLENDLAVLERVAENMVREIVAGADKTIAEYFQLVGEINKNAEQQHKENVSEFHVALTKALETEKWINDVTRETISTSDVSTVVNFLKEHGVEFGYGSTAFYGTKMADLKRKISNPFSESGI